MRQYEFVDFDSHAKKLGISVSRLRAGVLTKSEPLFAYVADVFATGSQQDFLPPYSAEISPFLSWSDEGSASEFMVRRFGRSKLPRYSLTGWVLVDIEVVRKILTISGPQTLHETWVHPFITGEHKSIVPLFVERLTSESGHMSPNILISKEDLCFLEIDEPEPEGRIDPRREASLLRIIASLRALLMTEDGGGFPSQAKIIDQLTLRFGAAEGLSKRNLEGVFADATVASGAGLRPRKD